MNQRPLVAAGTLLGIGLGGFIDGILFHQILQLHSMLSARLPQDELLNVKVSMIWDGLFHALTWATTVAGIALLWQATRRRDCPLSGRTLWGGLIMGWGIFNLVEGVIDHQLLGIHHIVERLGASVYDYLFLFSGGMFIGVGLLLIRQGRRGAVGFKSNTSDLDQPRIKNFGNNSSRYIAYGKKAVGSLYSFFNLHYDFQSPLLTDSGIRYYLFHFQL